MQANGKRRSSLSEESANFFVHVAQEIDVREVEISGPGTRRAAVFAQEVSEECVQLFPLPDDDLGVNVIKRVFFPSSLTLRQNTLKYINSLQDRNNIVSFVIRL